MKLLNKIVLVNWYVLGAVEIPIRGNVAMAHLRCFCIGVGCCSVGFCGVVLCAFSSGIVNC